jgi:hypothetical protein
VLPTPRICLQRNGRFRGALRRYTEGRRRRARRAGREPQDEELLPLCLDQRDERYAEVREPGRRLGQVRDCDVEINLLRVRGAPAGRGPARRSSPPTTLTRESPAPGHQEAVGLAQLAALASPAHAIQDRMWTAGWRERLRPGQRAPLAIEALSTRREYPNRLHRARIAVEGCACRGGGRATGCFRIRAPRCAPSGGRRICSAISRSRILRAS